MRVEMALAVHKAKKLMFGLGGQNLVFLRKLIVV